VLLPGSIVAEVVAMLLFKKLGPNVAREYAGHQQLSLLGGGADGLDGPVEGLEERLLC
jgi:hypothetical protein